MLGDFYSYKRGIITIIFKNSTNVDIQKGQLATPWSLSVTSTTAPLFTVDNCSPRVALTMFFFQVAVPKPHRDKNIKIIRI